MNRFARAVSFLLGPTFTLFPIIFISVAKFSHDYSHALKWTIISYAFVLPVVLFVIAGVILGYFSNFDVSKKEQRPLLFSFSAAVMFCYFLFIFIFNGPKILYVDLFAIVLGLIVIIFVNKWIKASIHLATLTSAVLFIEIVYKGYTFLLLGLIPLLAWSRVKTKEHSVKETIIGTVLGIVITLLVYLITKQFFMWLVRN
jgi:hypothetical protein